MRRNTGFLNYWTLSNIPLFCLAAPIFTLLFLSARGILQSGTLVFQGTALDKTSNLTALRILRSFALVQIVLALMIATAYHAQIIIRLSSGYPTWYIWLALVMFEGLRKPSSKSETSMLVKVAIRWMVMYATVQAALFASFLPPA